MKPIEELTTFKPFNVREIGFEVMDTNAGVNDQMLNRAENAGIIGGRQRSARGQQSNLS